MPDYKHITKNVSLKTLNWIQTENKIIFIKIKDNIIYAAGKGTVFTDKSYLTYTYDLD